MCIRDRSKAALFENIKGSKFKLVSNLVGSRDRFAQAIGAKKSGINIISTFIPKELENKTAKTLIAKIKEIVEK